MNKMPPKKAMFLIKGTFLMSTSFKDSKMKYVKIGEKCQVRDVVTGSSSIPWWRTNDGVLAWRHGMTLLVVATCLCDVMQWSLCSVTHAPYAKKGVVVSNDE